MGAETVFLLLALAAGLAALCHRAPTGATPARPRRVMRHINKRRQRLGLAALYMGDPELPEGWTCNDVRRQEWEGRKS